ncbi:MAG: hypothetical protein A4E51_01037 [Methanosaeta sp. PtaU1.Bin055]|nr:MAG: hypothetical protein A4E51_01037 [Methanosaeta sp. PtaU1.Bin055]
MSNITRPIVAANSAVKAPTYATTVRPLGAA